MKTKLKKNLIDTDSKIEKIENISPAEIINKKGEIYFRKIESEILEKYGKENNLLISTGGGAVTNKNAYNCLKQNGIIIWIKRDFHIQATSNRQLSKSKEAYDKLYSKRKDIYNNYADIIIKNDTNIEETIEKILEALKSYENSSN